MMRKKFSIRTHVVWFTLMPLMAMVILLEAFLLHDRYTELDRNLISRGKQLVRQISVSSEYGVFSGNRMYLDGITKSALQESDVKGIELINAQQLAIANAGDLSGIRNALSHVGPQNSVYDDGKMLLLYRPILSPQIDLNDADAKPAIEQEGAVVLEMSRDATHKQKLALLQFALLMTALFLLLTLYLVQIATRRIIKPITKLSEAIHSVGEGHLDTRVEEESGICEFSVLSRGINRMVADLKHERAILQSRISEATNQLHELAFYDTLTSLPNRRLLNDRLAQALAACTRGGYYGALLFIDLDNFKPLNDKFGHAAGDLLLVEAARRINACLREDDTVARFGGDEFVVMLTHLDAGHDHSRSIAQGVAEKIRTVLAEAYLLHYQPHGHGRLLIEHHCTSSIGAVLFMDHSRGQEDILQRADAAMYQAKNEGRNRICFHDIEPKGERA